MDDDDGGEKDLKFEITDVKCESVIQEFKLGG